MSWLSQRFARFTATKFAKVQWKTREPRGPVHMPKTRLAEDLKALRAGPMPVRGTR